MTREEAIRHLKFLRDKLNRWTGLNDKDKETFTMAISALEGANGDTISRQAAIEAIGKSLNKGSDLLTDTFIAGIESVLEELPAAQPERKTGEWEEIEVIADAYDISGVKTWASKMKCDQCGFTTIAMEGHFAQYNFCPNCGSYNGGGA